MLEQFLPGLGNVLEFLLIAWELAHRCSCPRNSPAHHSPHNHNCPSLKKKRLTLKPLMNSNITSVCSDYHGCPLLLESAAVAAL